MEPDEKIRMGTANAAREPAMTPQQAADALARGCQIAVDQIAAGADIIALGEMGIGNTASSALLTHRLAPAPLSDCIGDGAGQDDAGMARKRAAVEKAAARSDASSPFEVLCEFGGLEIAMMAGAVPGAASQRRPVLVDGFISSAAALLAVPLCPAARDYCVFAHRLAEKGHALVLAGSMPNRCSTSVSDSAKAPARQRGFSLPRKNWVRNGAQMACCRVGKCITCDLLIDRSIGVFWLLGLWLNVWKPAHNRCLQELVVLDGRGQLIEPPLTVGNLAAEQVLPVAVERLPSQIFVGSVSKSNRGACPEILDAPLEARLLLLRRVHRAFDGLHNGIDASVVGFSGPLG
jgi:hypothetical protein